MQVFLGHVTYHRSQNESSKIRERSSRDGDKFLCNRCPLKHEAREREGWNALREHVQLKTLLPENPRKEVQLISQVHDICGMGAAICNRVYKNWIPGMDAAIRWGPMNKLRYGRSHPRNESCNDYNNPQNATWISICTVQGLALQHNPIKVQILACE